MPAYPTWRRRLAAFGVFLVASAALIATSPAPPDRTELEATFTGRAEVRGTAETTGRVTLELSAAALPRLDDGLKSMSGTVTFSGSHTGVALTVRPLGVEVEPRGPERDTATLGDEITWPIEELCRIAEPCIREFEVTIALPDLAEDEVREAGFQAILQITYVYMDANPPGAMASWAGSPEITPPRPTPRFTQVSR